MKHSQWLWNRATGELFGESILFVDSGVARLAFPATELKRVYNPTLGCDYVAGKDFVLEADGRALRRLPGSSIPFLTTTMLYPAPEQAVLFPAENANAIGSASASPTGLVCFDGKDFFARHQLSVDYVTSAPLPELLPVAAKLPRTTQALRAGEGGDIAFIGDSITDGWNASGKVGCAPGQPPWAELVAELLSPRRMFNGAVSGSGSASGVEHFNACCEKFVPSLLFIAYGMNDLSHTDAAGFGRNIRAIMQAALERNPEMEFVLVSQMSGNPEWDLTPAGKDTVFAEELARIAAESEYTAFAPVNELWRQLSDGCGKQFRDLTGNGVNHPNDYGHRIYAFAVASLFR